MTERRVSAERVVQAEPQAIFDVLADPAMHPVIDGSGTVRVARDGNPERLALGATFRMDMKLGPVPYRMKNTVTEFEEGRRLAWHHIGRHTWRYELEPIEGGTLVRETWDWAPMGPAAFLVEVAGYPNRNRDAMEKTLARLAAQLESP